MTPEAERRVHDITSNEHAPERVLFDTTDEDIIDELVRADPSIEQLDAMRWRAKLVLANTAASFDDGELDDMLAATADRWAAQEAGRLAEEDRKLGVGWVMRWPIQTAAELWHRTGHPEASDGWLAGPCGPPVEGEHEEGESLEAAHARVLGVSGFDGSVREMTRLLGEQRDETVRRLHDAQTVHEEAVTKLLDKQQSPLRAMHVTFAVMHITELVSSMASYSLTGWDLIGAAQFSAKCRTLALFRGWQEAAPIYGSGDDSTLTLTRWGAFLCVAEADLAFSVGGIETLIEAMLVPSLV